MSAKKMTVRATYAMSRMGCDDSYGGIRKALRVPANALGSRKGRYFRSMPQEVAPVSTVAPAWSRPDDAVRQAQLDAMKRRATGLLGLAAVILVGASLFESAYPWLGYVRATAEASLVGGLADW